MTTVSGSYPSSPVWAISPGLKKTFPLLAKYPELDLTPGAFPNNEGLYCREWDPLNPKVNEIVFPMINQLWGGIYNNQVGTHEFVDFCRPVGADPLLVLNFESDGRSHWARPPKGGNRLGTAQEAGEWVDYCNNPVNALRRSHGVTHPYNVKLWQIGNETSYDPNGFDVGTAAQKTLEEAISFNDSVAQVWAVLDCRQNPYKIQSRLE